MGLCSTTAALPVDLGLLGFAVISGLLGALLWLGATLLLGQDIGNAQSASAGPAALGLFMTAVHYELTKDEGKG
jgi:hypothetical protein